MSSFTGITSAAGSGAKCIFPWIVCVVIFTLNASQSNELQPIYHLKCRWQCIYTLKKPLCSVCPHIVSTTLWKQRKRRGQSKHRAIKTDVTPRRRHRGVGMREDHRNYGLKNASWSAVRVYITQRVAAWLLFVSVWTRTCSIVRLQARIRVQSAHHEVVGEAARSRSGGRSAAAHPRCGAGFSVCGDGSLLRDCGDGHRSGALIRKCSLRPTVHWLYHGGVCVREREGDGVWVCVYECSSTDGPLVCSARGGGGAALVLRRHLRSRESCRQLTGARTAFARVRGQRKYDTLSRHLLGHITVREPVWFEMILSVCDRFM